MPEERDIEKQLRAAAEQRRQQTGAPFAMHPATRRMLHDEIRRVHGPKTTALDGKNPIFAGLWLRFAAGFCTATVLLIATWVLFLHQSPPKPGPLAQAGNVTAKKTSPSAGAPAEAKADRFAASKPPKAEMLAAPAPAVMASAAPAAPPAQNAQLFKNAAARRTEAAPPVLHSFQLEQRGDSLRIVDGDGSVYTGQLLAQAADAERKQIVAELAVGDATQQSESSNRQKPAVTNGFVAGLQNQALAQNAAFRAAGTNRSLQQNIIIHAQFFNGRVVGRATLADGRDVPLDAAPTAP